MVKKGEMKTPLGRKITKPFQWGGEEGRGDLVVADKDKWHENSAHIYYIGRHLAERGLDVEYHDWLVGYFESGEFLARYSSTIFEKLNEALKGGTPLENRYVEICAEMQEVGECIPPLEKHREQGWWYCLKIEAIDKFFGGDFEKYEKATIKKLEKIPDEYIITEYICEDVYDQAQEEMSEEVEHALKEGHIYEFIDDCIVEFFGKLDPTLDDLERKRKELGL